MASVPLGGSERVVLAGARALREADPHERLEVSVVLRPRARADLQARLAALHVATQGAARPRALSREAFARRHGASAADMRAVRRFARGYGLAVVGASAPRRTLMLSGTVAQFNAAFGVQLQYFEHAQGSFRGRSGPLNVPEELANVISAVLGLDNRPQASAHFRILREAAAQSFTPPQVASLYGFPHATGTGQCIALIELGGGFAPADLQSYFASLGIVTPKVAAVSVDHARNAPGGGSDGPDGEVMLDIEVAGAIAPSAQIVVYFAPNTDAGFLDAITTAVHDTTWRPGIVSISWGGPESGWTQQAMSAMDEALQAAAAMGVSVCIASGDNGSSDGVADGAAHVDFPASSPHALACGGTRLSAASGANSIASEVVWNDGAQGGASGGGVSQVFALPSWQQGLSLDRAGQATALAMRGVPDVAGNADPQTGYRVRVDGTDLVIGGTSAVAPLWAALIALIGESSGRAPGWWNPQLYGSPAALRDITAGNNGDYEATPGWDGCTGLGSPNGSKLAGL
ncbi:MAG TPA: S53 family peptidase [Steroidobacteraceae bacterium]|jgi:kumamolisin|nr:S53 family peptidase [Steroidobacteraceae bacterium]